MSATASWSYTNTATVWPLAVEADGWTSEKPTYGTPYQIACTWVGGGEKMTTSTTSGTNGVEFTPLYRFYHEDARVKYGDWIARGVEADRLAGDLIKAHIEYDMSPFGEFADFMSVT